MVIAVGGEGLCVGFWHGYSRGIFNDEPFNFAIFKRGATEGVALFDEAVMAGEKEGGGLVGEALVHRLRSHRCVNTIFQITSNLIERGESGDDRAEEALEKSIGGEFTRFANDEFGFACDKIEVWENKFRAVGG